MRGDESLLWRLVVAGAILFMFSCTVVLAIIWMLAYHNGGQLVVTINEYGEAGVEYVLWTLGMGMTVVGLTLLLERTGSDTDTQ